VGEAAIESKSALERRCCLEVPVVDGGKRGDTEALVDAGGVRGCVGAERDGARQGAPAQGHECQRCLAPPRAVSAPAKPSARQLLRQSVFECRCSSPLTALA
jgi:hypothetical protein